ncbi:hypothetical protein B5M09_001550 [Aphanomyces astaci]|uniref:Copine C-terminal domain-containing protein n=1 Tax=Aphanomyces astaci TaxID=112090 RepID=A0A3R7WHE0_APHAT|nr:hypothetical protein B5M09_001550 [Aphanomyces astaci]
MGSKQSKAGSVATPVRFRKIPDTFETYGNVLAVKSTWIYMGLMGASEELERALRAAGLESSNLIIGIDYTKSNTVPNHVISIMGRTLELFDDDKLIPVFGFGDATTGGSACFPFLPDQQKCHTFAQVLARYNQITPGINLAGPTNFAPIIREAINICQHNRSYHILVIIAGSTSIFLTILSFWTCALVDGHVNNQDETLRAIDMMEKFDDCLPARRFDNFQFVEYAKMIRYNRVNPDVGFATAALMEIPADTHRMIDILTSILPEQLQAALRHSGLESSNLILAIDYTKSNTVCLIRYESYLSTDSVIHILGRTLEAFDDDKLIPAFGFGDATTGGRACFPFLTNGDVCVGFDQVLQRYNQITPGIVLSGPTNFAPVIHEAIRVCQAERSYHILVIDTMEKFDDQLPSRRFDNFQFVEYAKMLRFNRVNPEVGFATAALMEIPEQYKLIRKLGML